MANFTKCDVAIIGAGLSGCLSAILLGRSGLRVMIIDRRPLFPSEFRAEQIVGKQVTLLKRLELLEVLVGSALPVEQVMCLRGDKLIDVVREPHYGVMYHDMVNRARQNFPPSVNFIDAQIDRLDLSAKEQIVHLQTGTQIQAKLVIMATGLGKGLATHLGVTQKVIHKKHTLAYGFDLEVAHSDFFKNSSLVLYGQRDPAAIDYLTVFPLGKKLRANLFTYSDLGHCWNRQFRSDLKAGLLMAFPALQRAVGEIKSVGPLQQRVCDLQKAENYRREGVVLVGDAFQTPGPAAGLGVYRLLNDIDRLCNLYVPLWLKTEGMETEKINQFYNDATKKRCDKKSLHSAIYRRNAVIQKGPRWRLHRMRVHSQRWFRFTAKRMIPIIARLRCNLKNMTCGQNESFM